MEFVGQSEQGFSLDQDLLQMSTKATAAPHLGAAGGNCSISPHQGMDRLAAAGREHMFDKVVTPSDVGKLNRLVIPKQHAEKYFPLDSSNNDKGLLLNFEDRTGKCWRFRYSYWNSSQSYVMTKGWSRFVKDKKLDAGDIVSFHRAHDRLFIDWCRRPFHPSPSHHFTWSPMLMRPPTAPASPSYPTVQYPHHPNHNHQLQYYHPYRYGYGSVIGGPKYPYGGGEGRAVVQGRAGSMGKKLRLFGVNMECSPDDGDVEHVSGASQLSSSSHPQLQLRLYNGTPLHLHHPNILTDNKGKAISIPNSNSNSLDLGLDM